MLEVLEVKEIQGDDAIVVLERTTACGDCGQCMVGKQNLHMEARVKNTLNAKAGDMVTVEMQLEGVLGASLIMYGIPLLFFILGCVVGSKFLAAPFNMNGDLAAILTACVFTALAYLAINIMDKKGAFKERYQLTMTGIVPQ